MTRDREADALAEALDRIQADQSSWLARLSHRLARWVLVKVGPFAAVAVALAVLLHLAHVDLGWLLMAMFYASPVLAAAVASFIVHAWRQNTGLTWTAPTSQVDLATEPAQPGQANRARPGQVTPDTAGHLAKPTQSATVTVTVLPGPVAALPQADEQTAPIHYETEEETGA